MRKESKRRQLLNLESSVCDRIQRVIMMDTEFLDSLGIMDYSLNLLFEVAVRHDPSKDE